MAEHRRGDVASTSVIVSAAIWLVFLYYPIGALINEPLSPGTRMAGSVVLVAFVIVYLSAFVWPDRGRPRARIRLVLTFATLAILSILLGVLIGPIAFTTLPFLVAVATFPLASRLQLLAIGTVAIGGGLAWVFMDPASALSIGVSATFVLLIGLVVNVAKEQNRRAQQLQLENAAIKERDKMAADVHDLIGHSLTVVALKTQVAQRLVDSDPAKAKAELAGIREIVSEALSGVRSTVDEARTRSLRAELDSVQDALASAGIEVSISGDQADIPGRVRNAAAWIVRESATNILRHSGATRCQIALSPRELSIEDDGTGATGAEGAGIVGMRKRAMSADAKLSIAQSAMGGMKVQVRW